MTPQPLLIWGGTGHAGVIREAIDPGLWYVVAIFDNRDIPSPFVDVPIFVGKDSLPEWLRSQTASAPISGCVAIGGAHGKSRLELADFLQENGISLPGIVHRTAFVATTATYGDGCQILAQSAVCADARLGRSVIVNTAASVDHGCVIGDGVHIAPGARLAGEVTVEACAFIGTGATVLPRIRIGRDAIIGAGSVVTHDVPSGVTMTGSPARAMHAQE